MARLHLICLSLAIAAAPLSAQTPPNDLAERQKQMRDLADQKMAAHVNESIADAEKLAKTSVNAAVEMLKRVKLGLDTSLMSAAKREELIRLLDTKILGLTKPGTPAQDPAAPAIRQDRDKAVEAMKVEVAEVNKTIQEIAKLHAEGKSRDADLKSNELAQKYPNNPAVIQLLDKGTLADRLANSRDLAKMQNDRVLYAMNDVARSSIPVRGDIEFPKDWKERTKNRVERMSPEMERILKALDKAIPTQLQSMPFEESIQQIATEIDLPIYLDKRSLEDIPGFDLKKAVSPLAVPNGTPLSARTVLRAMLQSQGLTFVVKDNVIQVVTVEKAKTMTTKKAYYIGDVVQGIGPTGGAVRWGPLLDYEQTQKNIQIIVDAIRGYDPMAWSERGNGASNVIFHYPSMSLIVTAPAEVHATLGSKIGPGR